MGAAASSQAALRQTLAAALGPGSQAGYSRLPRDPRLWTMKQVGAWLREMEMPSVAATMAEHNVDGQMLLGNKMLGSAMLAAILHPRAWMYGWTCVGVCCRDA